MGLRGISTQRKHFGCFDINQGHKVTFVDLTAVVLVIIETLSFTIWQLVSLKRVVNLDIPGQAETTSSLWLLPLALHRNVN